jgi:hypothetical protein
MTLNGEERVKAVAMRTVQYKNCKSRLKKSCLLTVIHSILKRERDFWERFGSLIV